MSPSTSPPRSMRSPWRTGPSASTAGLMDLLDDGELLFVVGHEIGHVEKEHIRKKIRLAYAASAVRKGIASQGGAAGDVAGSLLGGLAEALLNAQFSQFEEKEADDAGLRFLKRKAGNPGDAVSALRKIAGAGPGPLLPLQPPGPRSAGGAAAGAAGRPGAADRGDRARPRGPAPGLAAGRTPVPRGAAAVSGRGRERWPARSSSIVKPPARISAAMSRSRWHPPHLAECRFDIRNRSAGARCLTGIHRARIIARIVSEITPRWLLSWSRTARLDRTFPWLDRTFP